MPVPDDFCIFILTHGRPDRVHTYRTLMDSGYTGKVFIVIDDEDKTEPLYRERYGDLVLQFSKVEIAKTFDEADNFDDRRTIVYARNACFVLAERVGCRRFMQFDDDYTGFEYTVDRRFEWAYAAVRTTMDEVVGALLDFHEATPALTVAMAQGGDFLGGATNVAGGVSLRRKAMNSFVCSLDRPFQFVGRVNEDVNTYTTRSRLGDLFFTVIQLKLVQKQTQSNAGGMTDVYLDAGTYLKTAYTPMFCPSGVSIGEMGDPRSGNHRIHHAVNWHRIAPKILRESHKRGHGGE
jgi:hypothetical protein